MSYLPSPKKWVFALTALLALTASTVRAQVFVYPRRFKASFAITISTWRYVDGLNIHPRNDCGSAGPHFRPPRCRHSRCRCTSHAHRLGDAAEHVPGHDARGCTDIPSGATPATGPGGPMLQQPIPSQRPRRLPRPPCPGRTARPTSRYHRHPSHRARFHDRELKRLGPSCFSMRRK